MRPLPLHASLVSCYPHHSAPRAPAPLLWAPGAFGEARAGTWDRVSQESALSAGWSLRRGLGAGLGERLPRSHPCRTVVKCDRAGQASSGPEAVVGMLPSWEFLGGCWAALLRARVSVPLGSRSEGRRRELGAARAAWVLGRRSGGSGGSPPTCSLWLLAEPSQSAGLRKGSGFRF